MDLPRLKSLYAYWDRNPPLHLMAKAYLGIGGDKPQQSLAEASEFIPSNTLSESEFNEILAAHGLPAE